mgnify:FL=1
MKVIARRRAVSTLVATILMINTAIAMGAVMIAWAMGLIGTYQGGTQVQYMLIGERAQEAIVIENVWLQGGATIKVFVRNVGSRDAEIRAVYVNGTSVSPSPSLPYRLYVSGNLTLTISISHNARYPQLIVVATARGNQARGEWTA